MSHGHSQSFIRNLLHAQTVEVVGRHVQLKRRHNFSGPVPVSRRKVAFVQRQPDSWFTAAAAANRQ
jgi:hypothetical protein